MARPKKQLTDAEAVKMRDVEAYTHDDKKRTTADEDSEAKISKADAAAILRETVDTVGQKGKRGEQIRNVISVGMLSEGWDAKTVTHNTSE